MNLYKTAPSFAFLDIVADFIQDNFTNKQSFDKLKVILPSGLACLDLQKILIKRQDITILPNIIPFSNIIAEGAEIFKLSSEQLISITSLEEKIILAEIIHNYPKLQFSIAQSLQFCPLLAQLFYELLGNNVSITSIDIGIFNQSKYWRSIYAFLQYSYKEWQIRIKALQKQDRVHYQINMLAAEIERIRKNETNLIIAGMFGYDSLSWNFLKDIANSSSSFIILPPIGHLPDSLLQNSTKAEGDALYCLKQLLKTLNKNLSDFKLLGDAPQQATILDQLIINDGDLSLQINDNSTKQYVKNFNYIELANIYQEAEQISLICQQYRDKNIAIVVNNQKAKEFYCNFLVKYSLEFQDLLGSDLVHTHISHLIITISEVLCNEFDLKKLFFLVKNPLINRKNHPEFTSESKLQNEFEMIEDSDLVQKLEMLMLGKNRFISTPDQMLAMIEKTADNKLVEWCQNLINLLYKKYQDKNFINILKSTIHIAEKLCANIWYEQSAVEISKFFAELIKLSKDLTLENKEEFPKILKSLISGHKYFDNKNYPTNIIIGKAEDLIFTKFDLVILADFSEGNWPPSPVINPWLNTQIEEKLRLTHTQIRSSISLYYFYLLLHNDQVIITRSKKQGSKSRLLPSNYMLKLKFILANNLSNEFQTKESIINIRANNTIKTSSVHSNFFPNILSVTDIEMLIRNPYSFYAKKILNLQHKNMIGEEAKIFEYGNFIHNVLEKYTKNYNRMEQNKKILSNKVQHILDISTDILHNSLLPIYIQKIWRIKFQPIARAFIEFDEKRRKNTKYVYSELKGEMLLNIAGHKLKIIGVADRIEVDDKGRAVILDYKTGTVPSKKDIESGLSPQLIIEALMILEGSFGIEIQDIEQIIYVKFSSSQPYIQTIEITLTREDLAHHKIGMISLLEYYIINKEFSYEIDLLKYNNYVHLSRKV